MNDEDNRLVKDFKFWSVFIAKNQILPGKCVIWCKRENALDPADATSEEWLEVSYIIKLLKDTVLQLYKADWFNYTFLGNSTHHLHMHFVPRYKTEVTVHGVKFIDKNWGREYQVDPQFKIPASVLQDIKNEMSGELEKLLKK
jgi:diadenosine tetraphosphate (Ap4A) HIT family hydrolase